MTDRPILFSAPMVRALIEGRKTQTRRALNPQPYPLEGRPGYWNAIGVVGGRICINDRALLDHHRKPKPGDRLYVREAWRVGYEFEGTSPRNMIAGAMPVLYEADAPHAMSWPGRLRQGMHMPRWASRITLMVIDVRVQRLQEISETDAIAEGIGPVTYPHGAALYSPCPGVLQAPDFAFRNLWDGLNAARGFGWDTNPWVCAISFRPILANIDSQPSFTEAAE